MLHFYESFHGVLSYDQQCIDLCEVNQFPSRAGLSNAAICLEPSTTSKLMKICIDKNPVPGTLQISLMQLNFLLEWEHLIKRLHTSSFLQCCLDVLHARQIETHAVFQQL